MPHNSGPYGTYPTAHIAVVTGPKGHLALWSDPNYGLLAQAGSIADDQPAMFSEATNKVYVRQFYNPDAEITINPGDRIVSRYGWSWAAPDVASGDVESAIFRTIAGRRQICAIGTGPGVVKTIAGENGKQIDVEPYSVDADGWAITASGYGAHIATVFGVDSSAFASDVETLETDLAILSAVNAAMKSGGMLFVTDPLYGTVDLTGVASSQTAVAAAVAAAYTAGAVLFWPAGTYLTTATIPNFHSVKHTGPGIVKRGSDLWYISPTSAQTNICYVAESGSDSNDGITSSQPIETLSKVKAVLINATQNVADGIWRFKFAAGTYTDSSNFPSIPKMRNQLEFIGTGTARDPQTIFDGTGAAYQTACMYFTDGVNIKLQYIKAQDFTGYGFIAERNCTVEFYDCDAEACNIGFSIGYSSYGRFVRTLANDNASDGYRVSYDSQASWGPGGGGSLTDSARATGNVYGFHATRNSVCHLDYCEAWDNTAAGAHATFNSRIATIASDFQRNPVAFRGWTGSWLSQDAGNPNDFHMSDAVNRNLKLFEFSGGSGDTAIHGQGVEQETRVYYLAAPLAAHTGTGTDTQVIGSLFTVPAGYLVTQDVKLRVKGCGTTTSVSSGFVNIFIKAAATNQLLMPTVGGVSGRFEFEGELLFTGDATQIYYSKMMQSGQAPVFTTGTRTLDYMNSARTFALNLDISGDTGTSITIEQLEIWLVG